MLVAVVVLGMLIGLLNQGMGFASRVATLQTKASDVAAEFPVVDAALRRLIAAADPGVYPEPASLTGTNASFAMVTQAAGADGVPRPVDMMLFTAGGALRVRLGLHRHVEPPAQATAGETTVLLAGVQGMAIDYADGATGAWHASWTAETLPVLVRIRLTMADRSLRWPPIVVAPRLEAPGE